MYATLTFRTSTGPALDGHVRDAVTSAMGTRDREEVLPETWILFVDSLGDFLDLRDDLVRAGDQFPGQLFFAVSIHNKRQKFHSNGTYDEALVRDIITR